MNDLDPIVFEQDGDAWVSTAKLAEVTGKQNKNIMRTCDRIKAEDGDGLRFEPVSYMGANGELRPCYLLDQLTCFIVIGRLSGAIPLEIQVGVGKQFFAMKAEILSRDRIEADKRAERLEARTEKLEHLIEALAGNRDQQQDSDYLTLTQLIRLIGVEGPIPKAIHGAITRRWIAFMHRRGLFHSCKNGKVQFERSLTPDFITEALRDSIKEAAAKHRRKYSKQADIIDLFDNIKTNQ